MEVTKVPKKIVTVIEPKRSMTVDKEKYRQKRVAAYCRVSTDSEEQLVSYTNQKKVYTEMIASRKDWCFAGLFADEGKSGTRADKRPEFNKMINDCLAGKIDYIITKSVSRFARNTVDCLDYVRMLKSKGIGVYFEEQQIDTLKTDSELYLVIYAGFAQSESESISKNITWSVRKKFEEGTPVFMYKRFLGYKKGADGEPEIVPSEVAIVERIICAENPAFERSTFDSWDFFIWGNLSDLEMLLQKPVENENDGYISKDLLKGLLVRIQDQIQIFRQTIPYFVTDRSSEMPIRIIICEL